MPVAFLDLAQQCAPQIARETIAAVVSVESGFQPFAIRINSDRPLAKQPKTRAEAIETATVLIAERHNIDLGLGGINSGNLGRLGLSVSDAFDFCLNLKASAILLDGYYRVALQRGATTAQAETIMLRSYFGNGDASVGEMVGYESRILAERARLSGRLESIEIAEAQAQALPARERAGEATVAAPDSSPSKRDQQPSQTSVPRWDVFNPGRQSSVLVFSNEQKE
ncbi:MULTISPECIES: lytic transglycosylase domain-containing protein [unclassified Mesorhizobium]|uniref:lytic transglycosylase domain-containing protein n=1 Tax=unclassified Mesorhizobium TaxID=325217 RepID=UPI00112882E0|nr:MULTISPECIES: lytic transglycosylase domain-containing protein [unclassified Mesorhizobium]MBZ9739748.1 lytic transglycosylase domain-containing protein [Mesorhizobium sp. CO1-1-4]MBZ9804988.1 lytic transglycosylase domain-containing protein [Mesorhizobium sp. ES1-6]TPL88729.1 lytic transglycosylase domain-containing protein [Mesorhizobium sp. B2-3-12]